MTVIEKARKIAARLAYIHKSAESINVSDILSKASPEEINFYYSKLCEVQK